MRTVSDRGFPCLFKDDRQAEERIVMRQNLLIALVGVIAVSAVSCNAPGKNAFSSTRTVNRKMDATKGRAHRQFTDMVDNAMLHDMSIVDEHFVPHTTELNGTGAARLERMAILLNTYGGTVRYDSRAANSDIIADRIAHVREYLEVSGCDMSRVKVESMISGGRGERAVRSIATDDRGPSADKAGGTTSTLLTPAGN